MTGRWRLYAAYSDVPLATYDEIGDLLTFQIEGVITNNDDLTHQVTFAVLNHTLALEELRGHFHAFRNVFNLRFTNLYSILFDSYLFGSCLLLNTIKRQIKKC